MAFISNSNYRPHTFYIPVMGTSFTIDTPLRVAKYGISSVVSLSDDVLIEKMRKHYCLQNGYDYSPVKASDPNARSKKITAYLDLLDSLVQEQINSIKQQAFCTGSDLDRYFELLPAGPLKQKWQQLKVEQDINTREMLEQELRDSVKPGRIDVNIMTKVDPEIFRNGQKLAPEYGLAQQALKGFAESSVNSAVIFSAGMNPGLFSYTSSHNSFFPDSTGFKKEIILKVSDFRSALIQGKFLAKRGLWVSEFRVESGINCGGHAFVSHSQLMGPVLEEFLTNRQSLLETLQTLYRKALVKCGYGDNYLPGGFRITAQGGIGTAEEHDFIIKRYELDAAGWGTPFLLVPEAVSIDEEHLHLLSKAREDDVYLSEASPLGVPFWMLKNSSSEQNRKSLIDLGRPGSSCPRGYLKFDKEFTEEPICKASSEYQSVKLQQIDDQNISKQEKEDKKKSLLAKACLCRDLAGSALAKIGKRGKAKPVICPGPNISNFFDISKLKDMIDHIYGRLSLLRSTNKPHMFIREMGLYINRMRETIASKPSEMLHSMQDQFKEFEEKVAAGIKYYQDLACEMATKQKAEILHALDNLSKEFSSIQLCLEPA